MRLNMRFYWLMTVLCALLKGCYGVQNGATELTDAIVASSLQESPTNGSVSVNEARGGGRRAENTAQRGA